MLGFGGACNMMAIIRENGHDNMSSNLERG